MLLKVYYYDHPVLRRRCEPVPEITESVRTLISDMIETMDQSNAIGLAAPQVGHSLRIFVLRDYLFDEKGEEGQWRISPEVKVYINPKLSNPDEELLLDIEGCVSLPGLKMPVLRPRSITIEALDLEGKLFKEELEGYNARVRMHENDHLNGVLFIDRLDPASRKKLAPELKKLSQLKNR